MMSEEKKIVTKDEAQPCGCHVREFSDKSMSVRPCPGHGLLDAARALNMAAQALNAVGGSILSNQQQAAMAQAVSKVVRP